MYIRVQGCPKFLGFISQTPNLRLAQIVKVYQVPGPSGDVLPRLESSEDLACIALCIDLDLFYPNALMEDPFNV